MEEKTNNQKYKESLITDNTLMESTNLQNSNISELTNNDRKDSLTEFRKIESSFKPAKDKEDNFFKRKLFGEEWFIRSKYIDIDLVQDNLSSFKYLWCECQNLELICNEQQFTHSMLKPDLFESKNVRTIVRNGIPPKYMNKFILRLIIN